MAKNGEKTAEKVAFIEWWFTVGRDPRTMTEWAAEHKVAIQTLSEWKRSPEFVGKQEAYRTLFRADFVDATRVMLGRAKQGDVAAYVAVAKVLGENAPDKVDVNVVDRVAYVEPTALRDLAIAKFPELN